MQNCVTCNPSLLVDLLTGGPPNLHYNVFGGTLNPTLRTGGHTALHIHLTATEIQTDPLSTAWEEEETSYQFWEDNMLAV